MKKTLLALAFVGALMVSCKEKTEDKVEDATEAVGTEMTDAVDTTAAAIDTTAAKVEAGAAKVEAGAAKVEAGAKEVKDAVKK